MSTPQITYRQLDANGDVIWGQGRANFLTDLSAVEQAILTRLKLFQGEWWASLTEGLPLWQSILAQGASLNAQSQMETLISAVILGSPFVVSLSAVTITFDPRTRTFSYSASVDTSLGTLTVTNFPMPPSGALPL